MLLDSEERTEYSARIRTCNNLAYYMQAVADEFIQPEAKIGNVGIRWLPYFHSHVENPQTCLVSVLRLN
jgi:hypothetical protein